MCLITYTKKIQRAYGNKICYKVLVADEEGNLITPYTRTPVPEDVISGEKLFQAKGERSVHEYTRTKSVSGGFIHTFVVKSDALEMADRWRDSHVFKCVIPHGRHFYHGTDELDNSSFASKVIKFVEELDETKYNY